MADLNTWHGRVEQRRQRGERIASQGSFTGADFRGKQMEKPKRWLLRRQKRWKRASPADGDELASSMAAQVRSDGDTSKRERLINTNPFDYFIIYYIIKFKEKIFIFKKKIKYFKQIELILLP